MATHGITGVPVHPYLDWAIETQFAHLRPGEWLPLLVEFDPKRMSQARFVSCGWLDDSSKDDVRVPRIFEDLPDRLGFSVLFLRKTSAELVVQRARWKQTILRAEMGPPSAFFELEKLPIAPVEEDDADDADCQCRLAVAVIDEGIGFANLRFRKTSMLTRIEFLLRQDPGIELTAAAIDAEVAKGEGEDSVYRSIGGLDMSVEGYKPLAHRHAHGTHVLDLASGYDPNPLPARPPIIGVDMPEYAVGDPAGATLEAHATLGLFYIWLRAMAMRRPNEILLVVVNLSYAIHQGPHDGSSEFEELMDALIALSPLTRTPIRIVLPAGNFRQSRAHATAVVVPGPGQSLAWRLQPCDLAPSFMEIWFRTGANLSVTLTSPSGATQTLSTAGSAAPDPSGFWIRHVPEAARSRFLLNVPPTAADPWAIVPHPVVPSGIWTVLVKTTDPSVHFDAWIKRGETLGGRRAKGRQSYFDDPAYIRFEPNGRLRQFDVPWTGSASYVRRQGTISGLATGRRTYVIGAHRRDANPFDQMPAAYSSQGSSRFGPGGGIRSPDMLAPCEDAFTCPGALGAGTRSGARVAMNGTSAAAPQWTRYLAENWTCTGTLPPPTFYAVSPRVPFMDRPLVAGSGVARLGPPPIGRVWKNRP